VKCERKGTKRGRKVKNEVTKEGRATNREIASTGGVWYGKKEDVWA
jgi:hypothetical protein